MFPSITNIFLCILYYAVVFTDARPNSHLGHQHAIRWVDCAQNVPQSTAPGGGSFNASTVDLQNLPSTLHCGRLDVPMDYSKPFCDENKITLGVATYRPIKPKGPLIFCPGGTDPGVVVAWEVALNLTDAFSGLEDFELIVMDIRGTQSSNPLNVSTDLIQGLELLPYPQDKSDYDAIQALSVETFQSWINNSSPAGILEHVGTREVTQDYEMIRQALGYDKINFLGASYGSFRAQQYAATFPERVGLFVLDAVVPHGLSFHQQAQDDIAAQNRALQRADAYCMNDSKCPFYGQGRGSVIKAFKQVLEMAPYCLPPCKNDTASNNYLTEFDIRFTVENGNLLTVPDFSVFITSIDEALKGNVSLFAGGGSLSPEELLDVAQAQPIVCSDNDFPKTFEYFNQSLADGLANDITGIGMTATWLIMKICSGWTFPVPPAISGPLYLDQKMLLVTADFDAAATTEWATYTWGHIPHGVLVDRHGDDHVSFPLVDQPSTKITKDFLNTGRLPKAQNSTLVTVYTPGMVRGPIEDPYLVPTGAKAGDVDSGVVVEEPF